MDLQKKIQEKKSEFQSSASKEVQETIGRAIESLRNSGIQDQALGQGDPAPDFTLANAEGRSVSLYDTLSSGPIVLGFYRGRW